MSDRRRDTGGQEPRRALDGVRVLDLTHQVAGPSATLMLAFLGAEVVKVIAPGSRDSYDSIPFYLNNASKKSVELDLKSPAGRATAKQLAAKADIFVENFSPGVIERLGLGWDVLSALNPRLIYAQVKGFAADSPYRDFPCFDPLAQGFAGATSITGEPDGLPMKPGPDVGDTGTGMVLVGGILAALYQRQRDGLGQRVEIAMTDQVATFMRIHFGFPVDRNMDTPRFGNGPPFLAPTAPSDIFPCPPFGPSDYVHIHCGSDRQWERMVKVMGREDLLADAGLDASDVDGIARFAPPFEQVSEPMLVRALGIPELRFFAESPLGGEALGAVIAHAAAAIVAGLARVVVVYRALSQSTGGRFGRADRGRPSGPPVTGPVLAREAAPVPPPSADVVVPEEDNRSFAWPYGLMSPGQLFALWARRYAYVNKLTDDELTRALGSIAITQRRYANRNPAAMMQVRSMTWDDYYAARMISEPLRLFDLCLENDGACAYVLTSAGLARSLRDDPVYVLSATQTLSPYREPMGIYVQGEMLELFPPSCAERLFAQAGVSRCDIDVAELYDATSYMPLRSLESYGFVRDGEAWRYVTETGTGPDSPLPVNTHGGHLSEAYLHGMNGVLEAVRQLRGTAVNQVPGATVALVGAPAGSATILAR